MRTFALAAAILLLLPTAAASFWEQEVEGDFDAGQDVRIEARVDIYPRQSVIDLTSAVAAGEVVRLEWGAATGERVEERVVVASMTRHRIETRTVPLTFDAGTLTILACHAGCQVALLWRDGSEGRIEAPTTRSTLAWTSATREFFALARQEGVEDSFYHAVPAGALAFTGMGTDEEAQQMGRATLAASGAWTLLLHNATARFDDASGSIDVDTAPRSEPVGPSTPLPGAPRDVQLSFVLLDIEEILWKSDEGTHATLLARAATLRVDGTLRIASATGELRVDGAPRRLDGDPLVLEGRLVFDASARGEGVAGTGILTAWSVQGRLSGSTDRVVIAGVEAPTRLEDAASQPLTIAALLAALALVLLRGLALAPLYSRLDRARVLGHEKRRAIMDALRADPGLTAVGLARKLGTVRAVALHHLAILQAHRLVAARRVGWERCYYMSEGVPDARALAASIVLADKTRLRIAQEVARGAATQASIMERTGAPQRLVSYHLRKLERAGMVHVSEGRPKKYGPAPPLEAALRGPESATGDAGARSATG